jgi:hypothetical protein
MYKKVWNEFLIFYFLFIRNFDKYIGLIWLCSQKETNTKIIKSEK